MIEGKPSRTAMVVAAHRADHQILENGMIFQDPLALRLIGEDSDHILQGDVAASHMRTSVRLSIAARARAAEDAVADEVSKGLTQLVVLGAGLDSFAYRNPHGARLQVFEVDLPATQAWKLERLTAAKIAIEPWVNHVAVDFETEGFLPGLIKAGFDPKRRSFFMWMGVVYYLTEPAMFSTLSDIASLPGGATLVFDYLEPMQAMQSGMQSTMKEIATRVAALGESLITFFSPQDLHTRLTATGFNGIEDWVLTELAMRYLPGTIFPPGSGSAHVLLAHSPFKF